MSDGQQDNTEVEGEGPEQTRAVDRFGLFADEVNHRLKRLERQLFYRWAMTFLSILVAAVLFTLAQHKANQAVREIQVQRTVGIKLNCAIIGAVAQQGRAVILQGSLADSSFTKFLEAHGYPTLVARRQAAKLAADAYRRGISKRIDQVVGSRGDALVNRDGTINCRILHRLQH